MKELEAPLRQVFTEDIDRVIEGDRIAKITRAKRNYLYWQGKQYLTPKVDISSRTIDWISVLDDEKHRNQIKFASVYNIIYSDGIKFVSVVGQRKPNQKCVPDDPDDEGMAEIARDADAALRLLHQQWDISKKMKEIAFHLWTTGPVFGHTHYVSDGLQYGYTEVPNIQVVPQMASEPGIRCTRCGTKSLEPFCPACGYPLDDATYEEGEVIDVPKEVGPPTRFENGGVALDLYSQFYVTTPPKAKETPDCDFLTLSEMINRAKIGSLYGKLFGDPDSMDLKEEEDVVERIADDAIDEIAFETGEAPPTGREDKFVHEKRWVTPEVFHALPADLRRRLLKEFPDGMRTTFVGSKLIEVEAEKLTDYWAVCKSGTGEYLNSPGICDNLIPIQDDVNDFANLGRETITRGIPKTFVDSTLFDRDALEDNNANVAEIIPVKNGADDISKRIGQLPMARFSDQMMAFQAMIRDIGREVGGIQPAIYGGADATPTWRQSAQQKNQALMQLQPPFENMHDFVSEVDENGIRELARNGSGELKVAPAGSTGLEDSYLLNISMLQEKGWHVEAAESVPMSYAEKSARIAEISQENPELAATLGLHHPMNTGEVQRFFGVEGMYMMGHYERLKAMDRIKELLQEGPVQGVSPFTGEVQMLPALEGTPVFPDPYTDKPYDFYAELIRAWCNSPSGLNQFKSNPQGYQNVRLFGVLQDQMANPPVSPVRAAQEEEAKGGQQKQAGGGPEVKPPA